jgi:hypothetical protein
MSLRDCRRMILCKKNVCQAKQSVSSVLNN